MNSQATEPLLPDPEPATELLSNPGFELGTGGQVPPGWYSGPWQAAPSPDFTVEYTTDKPRSGVGAALLRNNCLVDDNERYANLGQRIDVSGRAGHRLCFRANIRKEMYDDNFGMACLWIAAETAGSEPSVLTTLTELGANAFADDWLGYRLFTDLDQDVSAVHVGVSLYGNAHVWVDDLSLIDLGETIAVSEPPRELSDRGLENLIAFTRLLGYVRHFHASDEAAACDWDDFAVRAVAVAEAAADPADLAARLSALFAPLAPTLQVFPATDAAMVAPVDWWPGVADPHWSVVSYRHKGCSQISQMPSIYRTKRIYVPVEAVGYQGTALDPRQPFTADLGGGVACCLPLAVFADAAGTLPRAATSAADPRAGRLVYTGNDRDCRLAGIALAWNVIQHFYPYFDIVEVNWPAELRTALRSAATDPDEVAFLTTLRRMMAALQDGHARVYHSCSQDRFQIPVVLGWADDRLVVSTVGEGAGELQPGDLVLSINGIPVDDAVRAAEETAAAATPQRHRLIVSRALVQGAEGAEITIAAQAPDGKLHQEALRCTVPVGTLADPRPEPFCELKPGVFYLHLARGTENDIAAILPQVEQARGLVIDIRGAPGAGIEFLSHLTDEPMQSAQFKVPIFREPDRRNITEYDEGGRWLVEPQAPRLRAKVAFIIDASTQSYLECLAEFPEAYHLGEIVGEASSGSNGNVNPFILPGGYEVQWTGMIVLKNDGRQHHAVGILPTVPVARTIRGVAEGRDELLERAVELVSE